MLARAAGAAANRKLAEPHRIAPFEDLGIGRAGVGHVACGRRRPRRPRPWPPSRRRSFRSSPSPHRRTAGCSSSPGWRRPAPSAPSITSTMRCDVSTLPPTTAGHCSGVSPRGGFNRHSGSTSRIGREHALIQGDVFVDQAAEAVHDGRSDDRPVGVEIARQHRARAGEVDGGPSAGHGDGHDDRRTVVEVIDEAVAARRGAGPARPASSAPPPSGCGPCRRRPRPRSSDRPAGAGLARPGDSRRSGR